MEAEALLQQLRSMGIEVSVAQDRLRLRPGSAVPPDLIAEIREHKDEIRAQLKLRGYHLRHGGPQSSAPELEEIAARVEREGHILLWSSVLHELVAFYRNEEAKGNIPPAFRAYSEQELRALFGKARPPLPASMLRLIHEAKRYGARIRGREVAGE